jgi:hypothetical protein
MASFDVPHHDPVQLARAASIRSAREKDRGERDRARSQSAAERLREGFRLARFAVRLRDAGR